MVSDSKGSGSKGAGIRKTGGSNLKVPRNDTLGPVKFRDGSNLKVPPKPPATKPDKG